MGDLLLAFVPYEIIVRATDAEECLKLVSVEVAIWLIGGVVRHEVDNEVVSCWCYEDPREGRGEVVWVSGLR